MEFKDKLKQLRTGRGISQQALADAIFVSRSAVAKWENGLGLPNPESLTALAEFFGVEESHFTTDEPEVLLIRKNKHIAALNHRMVAVAVLIALCAVLIFPRTKLGMKLTVAVLEQPLTQYAQTQLADPPDNWQNAWGYEIQCWPEGGAVFFESYSFGYRGFFYSESGLPVGYHVADVDFFCYGRNYLWHEENGDNWMYAEHITGNWYYYEMHF